MCTTNRQRRKKLILAYPDTRRLYRMMQVLAVFLVVATICIFAVGKWSEKQIKEKNDQLFGRWNEVFLNVDEEDVEYFRQHAFVDDYSIQNIQEKIYLEGDDRIIIGTCDDNFFELGNLEMVDGRMPVNEGEVAIEEEYLDVLGVEKVGDIISEGVNIDSLEGYKVCGIVKDYSSRWKMVNWDVKYINCFISDAKVNEIQIYASLSSVVQQDIETNMLEYRENINIKINFKFKEILVTVLLLKIMLSIVLAHKIKHHADVSGLRYYQSFEKLGIFFENFVSRKNVLYFLKTVLEIFLCLSIIFFINRIVVKINMLSTVHWNSIYSISNYRGLDIDTNGYTMIIMNSTGLSENAVTQIMPITYICSFIEMTTQLFFLVFINYCLYQIERSFAHIVFLERAKYEYLYLYFHGKLLKPTGVFARKEFIKHLLIIGNTILFVYLIMYDTMDIPVTFYLFNFFIGGIIYCSFLVIQFWILQSSMRRFKEKNNWLLTAE